jgi:ABC-type nitrate/sulfonate/bicarbonate transport system ATPase subunit
MKMKRIDCRNLHFTFAEKMLFQDLNFHVADQEFVSLLGSSGIGKTTLLNLLSGHLTPSAGQILIQGKRRRIYQANGLLPWFTAEQNILLGAPKTSPLDKVFFDELVHELEIKQVLQLFPRQLSGGLRQRVEFARALFGQPDILLLDEPFSSIDFVHRERARYYLKQMRRKRKLTVVMVTHDFSEAQILSDRLLVLSGSPVQQVSEYKSRSEWSESDFFEKICKEML